jgi:hypothetical protein
LLVTDALGILLISAEPRVRRSYVSTKGVAVADPLSPLATSSWSRNWHQHSGRDFRCEPRRKSSVDTQAEDHQTDTNGTDEPRGADSRPAKGLRRQCVILASSRETPRSIPSLSAGSLCCSVSCVLMRPTRMRSHMADTSLEVSAASRMSVPLGQKG